MTNFAKISKHKKVLIQFTPNNFGVDSITSIFDSLNTFLSKLSLGANLILSLASGLRKTLKLRDDSFGSYAFMAHGASEMLK